MREIIDDKEMREMTTRSQDAEPNIGEGKGTTPKRPAEKATASKVAS